jgi:SAM-dependent methyltransferase
MARQPKLVLREAAIDSIIKEWPRGRFFEAGCGTGYMTRKFLELGFSGACFEISEDARQLLRSNLEPYGDQISILDSLDDIPENTCDFLLAFEVLEHIDDDLAALSQWTKSLKSNGQILLSVPAHQRKYSKSDLAVGHVRRYEREQVDELLHSAGFEDISILNYGFPLTEVTRVVSNFLLKGEMKADEGMESRSHSSSYQRQAHIQKLINFFGEGVVQPFVAIQGLFYQCDWSDSIIAHARFNPEQVR